MSKITNLFTPARIGNVELKNRVIMMGMTMGLGDNYTVSDRLINFLAARARGGAGLIVLGSCYPVDLSDTRPLCHETPLGVGIWSDDFIPGLRRLTEAIHK